MHLGLKNFIYKEFLAGILHISGNQNTRNTLAGHRTGITLTGTLVTNEISTSGGSETFQDVVDLALAEVGIDTTTTSYIDSEGVTISTSNLNNRLL